LAARGVTVVLTARKPAAGATAAATLASEALRVDFHPLSVTDEASIRALRAWFAAVFAARPKVRILIEASTESEWVAQCLEGPGPRGHRG
jgi:NAD(P)-dependent dehydrogenase (short-subunit alcohol dehydrogenase family)